MTVNIGFIMDPIETINPKKDSTLAMMRAANKKGWKIFYIEQKH
ncbi:MAG: glutathione synthase, partial [Gammaproteobacteria bacterium]|nr:glutathione synthase [Gammaproteobacteria bacterium]